MAKHDLDKKDISADEYDIYLKGILKEIEDLAAEVVRDYEENPSEMSGSIHQVFENSPVLQHEELKMKYKKD